MIRDAADSAEVVAENHVADSGARAGRPIGVFDSGVGGLTVASALMRRLPDESVLYLGDTARLPYGTKSAATVERYTRRNIDFLVRRGVKAVVVACNTASAVISDELDLPVPVWGVIDPGADAALAAEPDGPIGILATESTIRSGAYARAIETRRPGTEVIGRACPLFVPLVEEGWVDDPVAQMVAERYLRPVLDAGCRTLVMGCTHYPLLENVLRRVAGPEVSWVDSASTVAERVAQGLKAAGLEHPGRAAGAGPAHHLCATDVSERFETLARRLLSHYGDRSVDGEAPGVETLSLEWVEV